MTKEKVAEMLGKQLGKVVIYGPPPVLQPRHWWWLVAGPLGGLVIDEVIERVKARRANRKEN